MVDERAEPLAIAQSIVVGLTDGAVLLDRELRPLYYNQRFLELTGLRRRALEQRLTEYKVWDLFVVVEGGTEGYVESTAQSCLATKAPMQLAEMVVRNQIGQQLTVYLTFIPIIHAGAAVGLIQAMRDVSDEARVQARYRDMLESERYRAESLEREVQNRTAELTAALEQVTRLSREDPLTGLLNRRAFTEFAEHAIKMARRHSRSVGILVGDLDHFKRVNDTYGHQVGDAVLVTTAQVLTSAVRTTDRVGRLGGEEFVILLSETAPDSVAVAGQRCCRAVAAIPAETLPGVQIPTISIGMAVFPVHGDSLDELVSRADSALYNAKRAGRNRALMYSDKGSEGLVAPTNYQRVLLVDATADPTPYREALTNYDLLVAESCAAGLTVCEREPFEVLIADLPDPQDGIDFLRRTLRLRPEALRVLVIESQDMFVEARGTNMARVDCYLLRREGPAHIAEAIESGLARRDLDRQRTLLASEDVRRLLTNRLAELEGILDRRAIAFAYQPIVDPRTREVRAYEALCRAQHPIFKNAVVLFEAAVQSGNLWRLGRLVREIATSPLRSLPQAISIFINLHPGEIEDPELLEGWCDVGPERLILEITERAAIPDFPRFQSLMETLGGRGLRFAIDDLGAGYASLNAVALLSPHYVKIDMAMTRGIDRSSRKATLVRRIVEFANDVGIQVVAEGVETAPEAAAVAELGCHLAQGYFYGRPSEAPL